MKRWLHPNRSKKQFVIESTGLFSLNLIASNLILGLTGNPLNMIWYAAVAFPMYFPLVFRLVHLTGNPCGNHCPAIGESNK